MSGLNLTWRQIPFQQTWLTRKFSMKWALKWASFQLDSQRGDCLYGRKKVDTIWLFDIAMEDHHF
jgi:hypothetical protein